MTEAVYEPSFFAKLKAKVSCCQKSEKTTDKTPDEQRADARERQVQDLREFFRELGIYLLMLGCFSLSIWLDSSSLQKHNLASIFMTAAMPTDAPSGIESFLSSLYSLQNATGACSGILCRMTTTDYFAAEVNHSSSSSSFFGSALLGQIRLRQVRVQKRPCPAFYEKLEATNCYPDYAAGAEETTFTKEWAPDFDTSIDAGFKWQSQSDIGEVRLPTKTRGSPHRHTSRVCSCTPPSANSARTQVIPSPHPSHATLSTCALLSDARAASGFAVDFSTDVDQMAQRFALLRDAHWIDIKTVRMARLMFYMLFAHTNCSARSSSTSHTTTQTLTCSWPCACCTSSSRAALSLSLPTTGSCAQTSTTWPLSQISLKLGRRVSSLSLSASTSCRSCGRSSATGLSSTSAAFGT
jgi:hypothetical protein